MDRIEFVINEDNKILADSTFQVLELIEQFKSWLMIKEMLTPPFIEVKIVYSHVFFILSYNDRFTVTFSIGKDQQDNAITVILEQDDHDQDKEKTKELFSMIMAYFGIGTDLNVGDIVLVKLRANSTRTHIVGKYYEVESIEKRFVNLRAYERNNKNEENFITVEYGDVEKLDIKKGDFVLGKEAGVSRWKLDVFDGVDGHGHALTKANYFTEIIPYKGNEDKLGMQ